MPRITPLNPDTTTGKAKDLLGAVQAKLGRVPNMMATMAHSPAVLDGYLKFAGALDTGALHLKTRQAIALTIAEANSCDYCLSAHTAIGKGAGLTDADITSARAASASDPKLKAILALARAINDTRGKVTDADLKSARAAGLTDPEITEVAAHVALNVFTNYFNRLTDPVIDFPQVKANSRSAHLATV